MFLVLDNAFAILLFTKFVFSQKVDVGLENLEIMENETSYNNDWESFTPEMNKTISTVLFDSVEKLSEQKEIKDVAVVLLSYFFAPLFRNRRILEFISGKHEMADVMIKGLQYKKQHKIHVNTFTKRNEDEEIARSSSISFIIYANDLSEASKHFKTISTALKGNEYGLDYFIILLPEIPDESILETSKKAWDHNHWFNVIILFITKVTNQISLSINMFNPFNLHNDSLAAIQKYMLHSNNTDEEWKEPWKYLRKRVRNLQGFPLRVTMDNYSWFSIPEYDSKKKIKKFSGKEGEVVHLYSQKLNYKPVYSLPLDGTAYGGAMSNGTIIGGVKDVNDGFADLYGNGIIVSSIDADVGVRFLRQLQQTKIVIIMPLPPMKIHHIHTVFTSFEQNVTTVMFFLYTVFYIVWFLSKLLLNPMKKVKKNLIDVGGETLLSLIGILDNVSITVPTNAMEKFLFFLLLYCALIINSIYTGGIITGLTIKDREKVNTLTDFVKLHYPIVCVPDLCEYLQPIADVKSDIQLRKHLYKMIEILKTPKVQSHIIAKYRNFTKIVPHFTALANQLTFFDEHGDNMLHILDEPLGFTYMSQVVPKWSPVSVSLNTAQIQIATAGLGLYWGTFFAHKLRLKRYHTKPANAGQPPINIENLKSIFALWVYGIGLSIIIFMIEIFIYFFNKLRKKTLFQH